MKIYYLLMPFTWLYKWITDFRNHLYNIGYKKSFQFEIPMINVGNLTVGGTGKTPQVEYLIRLLKKNYKIATLSRGYGRKSKGFLLADENSTVDDIGDEPLQFYKKFGNEIVVSVCEDRVEAVPKILLEAPDTQVIILDDAFQHRAIQAHINILLTDYGRLFFEDFPFPSGRLRESRKEAKRADIVIVSKCPDDLKNNLMLQNQIISKIHKYTQINTPIYFSGIRYGKLIPLFGERNIDVKNRDLILLSGIAQPQIFENQMKSNFNVLKHLIYKDHYNYQIKDIEKIIEVYQSFLPQNPILITTEKDFVKLVSKKFHTLLHTIPIFYLPIEVYFLSEEEKFQKQILNLN